MLVLYIYNDLLNIFWSDYRVIVRIWTMPWRNPRRPGRLSLATTPSAAAASMATPLSSRSCSDQSLRHVLNSTLTAEIWTFSKLILFHRPWQCNTTQARGVDMYVNGHDHCLQHISSRNRCFAWFLYYKYCRRRSSTLLNFQSCVLI
jgi:hypothetical protein